MTGDVFRECRERVSAEEAARHYGIAVERGKALCPFHPDKHPSMSFHRGSFRCWSCGASGSAVDFTARYFGLRPLDAVRKLNEDLSLGLALDRPRTREDREAERRREEEREAEALFRAWREALMTRLCAAIRVGNRALLDRQGVLAEEEKEKEKEKKERWTAGEVLAVRELARLEWRLETLETGSPEEQMEIFRERAEVEKLCQAILGSTGKRSEAA